MIKNVLANFFGKVLSAFVLFLFTPLYVKILGVEGYGLIGFFNFLLGFSILFDMGMGAALSRELASLSAQKESAHQMRITVRTMEILYWAISGVVLLVGLFCASWGASWFDVRAISPDSIERALLYMVIAVALQCPFFLYSNGLAGLQKQLLLNGLLFSFAFLRAAGSVMVLIFIEPTIEAFFLCQMAVSLLQSIAGAIALWRVLPPGLPAYFNPRLIKGMRRFALGMSGISISGLILTQGDKLILSKLFSMEMFGYFCLAQVVANGLNTFISSMSAIALPRFAKLMYESEKGQLMQAYHQSCQAMAMIVLPIAVNAALFSSEFFLLWTGREDVVLHASGFLKLLMIGSAMNGLCNIAYAFQLARGETKLFFLLNLASIALLFPLTIFITPKLPMMGATLIWVVLNLSYLLIGVPLAHRKMGMERKSLWWLEVVAMPLFGALLAPLMGRWLLSNYAFSPAVILIILGLTSLLSLGGAFLCSTHLRPTLKKA
jgi:O-antigen/teichoic acid export membrane protein